MTENNYNRYPPSSAFIAAPTRVVEEGEDNNSNNDPVIIMNHNNESCAVEEVESVLEGTTITKATATAIKGEEEILSAATTPSAVLIKVSSSTAANHPPSSKEEGKEQSSSNHQENKKSEVKQQSTFDCNTTTDSSSTTNKLEEEHNNDDEDEQSIGGIEEVEVGLEDSNEGTEDNLSIADIIDSLLGASIGLEKLEELYGKERVRAIARARILRHLKYDSVITTDDEEEEPIEREEKANELARVLFLRSSSSLWSDNDNDSTIIMDAVIDSLVNDPDNPLLLDPLMMTPLEDPVVLSSGYILDRATAINDDDGKASTLRMDTCPFSRQPLSLPVHPCIPIRNAIRAWEATRMEYCIVVATKFIAIQQWLRASRVLSIAETVLQRMGERTNLHFTRTLAGLERSLIPHTIANDNNLLRIVKIYIRLIRAVDAGFRITNNNKEDEKTSLLRNALKDCHQKMNTILFRFDDEDSSAGGITLIRECHKARQLFTNEVLTRRIIKEYSKTLSDELLDLYQSDLILAKNLFFFDAKYVLDVWSCRQSIIELLQIRKQQHKQGEENNIDEINLFLRKERLSGTEMELRTTTASSSTSNRAAMNTTTPDRSDNENYTKYWPKEKMLEESIGLIHFEKQYHSKRIKSFIDLNPTSNHWIEVAFRPLQSLPGKPKCYPIISQYGPGAGWEIRVGTVPSTTTATSSVHVEVVWTTTTNKDGTTILNRDVSIEMGMWYHIVLAYRRSTLTLYVNGIPSFKQIGGKFKPYRKYAMLGQSQHWKDRQLKCMVAFASGRFPFTEDEDIVDYYVTKLSKCRLETLRECSTANSLASF